MNEHANRRILVSHKTSTCYNYVKVVLLRMLYFYRAMLIRFTARFSTRSQAVAIG